MFKELLNKIQDWKYNRDLQNSLKETTKMFHRSHWYYDVPMYIGLKVREIEDFYKNTDGNWVCTLSEEIYEVHDSWMDEDNYMLGDQGTSLILKTIDKTQPVKTCWSSIGEVVILNKLQNKNCSRVILQNGNHRILKEIN